MVPASADTRLLGMPLQDPVGAAMDNGEDVSSRAGGRLSSAVRVKRRLGSKATRNSEVYFSRV
ncbi:RpiR family transcriptional regulator (fragment) (plasmid) [Agrobacterium pusense]|uniref:RpiR family transcriptional regulator n=1 Tax=Agrobacterium pusense TaxID=648995 RepID=U4Q4M5_9HYPH